MDLATKDVVKKTGKSLILITSIIGVIVILFSLIVIKLGLSFFIVNGDSMYPYLEHGDIVVVEQSDNIEREEIVFFNNPRNWEEYTNSNILVKRVIATPGDEIAFTNGILYVNDSEVFNIEKESYECNSKKIDGYQHVLTDSEIFVQGDNHNNSLDSLKFLCDGKIDSMYVNDKYVLNFGEIVKKF